MKAYFHPLVAVVALLFAVHQLIQHGLDISMPVLDDHFDPFCLGVICLYLLHIEHRFWFGKKKLYLLETLIAVSFISFVSEFVFPSFSNQFVADVWDVAAISMGGILYYKFQLNQ